LRLDKLILNRRLLRELDLSLLIIPVIISIFGAINIYSATANNASLKSSGAHSFIMQLIYLFVSLVLVYFLLLYDYIFISNFSYIFYWIGVALLVYTAINGKETQGARCWFLVFGVPIEPGEIIKVGLILLIAKIINDTEGHVNNLKTLIKIALYTALPVAFIIKEPNVGLAVICICIVLGMLFISNLDFKIIFAAIILGLLCCFLGWKLNLFQGHQMERINSFLHPSASSTDSTFQVDNSILAIGSGGLWGKGFLHSTQVSGGFIPEAESDMIFSVVGEEWGLIGALVLLLLYIILLVKILKTARQSKDLLGKLICVGYFSALLFSVYQNIGMTIRRAPVAGITLPFMSAGGSSLLSNFIIIGLILNVSMRKKKINF
jgi:rod shape determining protein RodA